MKLSRTAIAAMLVVAAVAVPCTAWWIAGSRAADREALLWEERANLTAASVASAMAERLGGRLSGILASESARPIFEYAYRYQDPQLSCECATWVESPLARGPIEPLLSVHFEIDRRGSVTVPSLPPDEFDDATSPVRSDQQAAQATIQEAANRLATALWDADRQAKMTISPALAAVATVVPRPSAPTAEAVLLPWGDETALVEPFRWHTVELDGTDKLVALRTVRPPDGARIQGFVVCRESVESALATNTPVDFRPMASGGTGVACLVPIDGVNWEIAVDPLDTVSATGLAELERNPREEFLRLFLGGAGSAALAAIFVVGMVRQSEKVAVERSRFAASAAHELRTPLAGMRLYGEMLADNLGDPDQSQSYAKHMAAEADRLSRVVTNVLGYTKLERGTVTLNVQPGDLGESLTTVVDKMRPAVATNGASLELDVPADGVFAHFDPEALEQIVCNLVDNAERYSRDSDDRSIVVRATEEGDHVRVTVLDRGPGVPAGERRRLFRSFDRGKDPKVASGLGLGLAIVSTLAQAQGGNASFAPRDGGGSAFTLELKRAVVS